MTREEHIIAALASLADALRRVKIDMIDPGLRAELAEKLDSADRHIMALADLAAEGE